MMLLTHFSVRPVPASMFLVVYYWTWNPQLLMKSELALIDNYSILNNLFPEKKMLLIILPEAIIPSEEKSLTFALIELENLLTIVLDFRDS
jgi:hypothetical protein